MIGKRIIVIGCPGSGKSTFCKKLHEKCGISLVHLDMLYWNADKTTVSKEEFDDRLHSILLENEWIIDGNYGRTMEIRFQKCDTVIFFDIPADLCIDGIKNRIGKPRSDMPWIESEPDAEFLEFVRNFEKNSKPKITELLERYSKKEIIVFNSREEADLYLDSFVD